MFKFVSMFLLTVVTLATGNLFLIVPVLIADLLMIKGYFATLAYMSRAKRVHLEHREIMSVGRAFGGKR